MSQFLVRIVCLFTYLTTLTSGLYHMACTIAADIRINTNVQQLHIHSAPPFHTSDSKGSMLCRRTGRAVAWHTNQHTYPPTRTYQASTPRKVLQLSILGSVRCLHPHTNPRTPRVPVLHAKLLELLQDHLHPCLCLTIILHLSMAM